MALTLNLAGRLTEMSEPLVMGILNVTPDSFYADSRMQDEVAICARVEQILQEGAWMIDVGAYSTRPGANEVSEEEELRRLNLALSVIRKAQPDALLSVDTFRASVARHCVEHYGVALINDVSGGADPEMFSVVADLHVPYVLTHNSRSEDLSDVKNPDELCAALARSLAANLYKAYEAGVADVIIDLGFGFGKTLDQNYQLMARLSDFIALFPDNPMLVGVSRKSMIWKALDCTPDQALNGTTALNTLALHSGAHILRVHDVQSAVEVVKIIGRLNPKIINNKSVNS